MKNAVFSFLPLLTSGACAPWWDYFPRAISNSLNENGIEHLCWYRDYANSSPYFPSERYKISYEQLKKPLTVRQLLQPYMRKYKKIIFHVHNINSNGLFIFSNKFNRNYHWVMTDHDLWAPVELSSAKRKIKILLRCLGLLPEIILGCSEASKERLQKIYGRKNIGFIYNGVDIPNVDSIKAHQAKPKKAIFVGRLEEYKGLLPLVEAFRLMNRKIDVKLTIVGKHSLYRPLLAYIEKEKLNDIITMTGHVKNVSRLMTEHDFIIIPSTYEENCPITSLEAQAHCLPCIYTNSGGLPETQINGKTGIMISKNSPEEIINAIKYFQEDIGRFNKMCLDARKNVFNFSIEKMAQDYTRFYLEIFGKSLILQR